MVWCRSNCDHKGAFTPWATRREAKSYLFAWECLGLIYTTSDLVHSLPPSICQNIDYSGGKSQKHKNSLWWVTSSWLREITQAGATKWLMDPFASDLAHPHQRDRCKSTRGRIHSQSWLETWLETWLGPGPRGHEFAMVTTRMTHCVHSTIYSSTQCRL